MSTSKRLVSLLMALVLVVGIFAIPALAATADETAEPYGVTIPCERCGSPSYRSTVTSDVTIRVESCNLNSRAHYHTIRNYYYLTSCSKCSWSYQSPNPYKTVLLACK